MNELDAWVAAACAELGLQPDDVKASAVLDVARDVAHQVLRPGAPVSAYLMGVAVGRGADPTDVADRLSALALAWPTRKPGAEGADHTPGAKGADRSPGIGSLGSGLPGASGKGLAGGGEDGRARGAGPADPPIP